MGLGIGSTLDRLAKGMTRPPSLLRGAKHCCAPRSHGRLGSYGSLRTGQSINAGGRTVAKTWKSICPYHVGCVAGCDSLGCEFSACAGGPGISEDRTGTSRWRSVCGQSLSDHWIAGGEPHVCSLVRQSALSTNAGRCRSAGCRSLFRAGRETKFALAVIFMAAYVGLLVASVPPLPARLVETDGLPQFVAKTTRQSTSGRDSGFSRSFDVAGRIMNYHKRQGQALERSADMRQQRMLDTLQVDSRKPSFVLVIGCGAGVTAGAVSTSQNSNA